MPPHPPTQTTPTITSHPPNSTVHSRLLLVSGSCGHADGHLWISAHHYNFPPQSFPVRHGHFKALIHLSPGENIIQLDFQDPSARQPSTNVFVTTYIPLLQNPPLELCIIVASDSPLRYDDVPNPAEPNSLETAIKKFRLAAYLWQAYTGSQMSQFGLGNRTFRLAEEWAPDSLTKVDSSCRQTAKVTVLRSKYNTAFIRAPERAQQHKGKKVDPSLFDIALEAIRPEFKNPKHHIAALLLDAHFKDGLITGHAALGGGTAQHALGIFGSHMLFSWPSCIENIIPAFNDTRQVDTRYCGIDVEGKTYWMAANIGIGAFMHEVGHALTCPHQSSGVMRRDYTRLNRSFSAIEPPSDAGPGVCDWHRLDVLRFRAHPCFGLPSDESVAAGGVTVLGIDAGILVSSPAGILFIELHLRGKEFPTSHLEFVENPPKQYLLPAAYLQETVGKLEDIRLEIFALNGNKQSIPNVPELMNTTTLPGIPSRVFRSGKFGGNQGQREQTAVYLPLRGLRIYSGIAFDGIEFLPASGRQTALYGRRGGSVKEMMFNPHEEIVGFAFRHGAWVDAMQVLTNQRRSEWYGPQKGGDPTEILFPSGYRFCGMYGDVANWVMGVGVMYYRV